MIMVEIREEILAVLVVYLRSDSDKAPGWYPNTDATNYSSTGIHGWYSKGVGEALYTVYSQSAGE